MKRLAVTTAIVVATLVCLALLWHLRWAVFLFFAALIAAAALRPLAEWPRRWGLSQMAALTVTYLAIVLAVCTLGVSVIGPLTDDVTRLAGDVTKTYEYVSSAQAKKTTLQWALARVLPPAQDLQETIDEVAPAAAAPGVGLLVGTSVAVIGALIDSVLVLVLSLYWNFDRVHFERLWLSLLSVKVRSERAGNLARDRNAMRRLSAERGAARSFGRRSDLRRRSDHRTALSDADWVCRGRGLAVALDRRAGHRAGGRRVVDSGSRPARRRAAIVGSGPNGHLYGDRAVVSRIRRRASHLRSAAVQPAAGDFGDRRPRRLHGSAGDTAGTAVGRSHPNCLHRNS